MRGSARGDAVDGETHSDEFSEGIEFIYCTLAHVAAQRGERDNNPEGPLNVVIQEQAVAL
jgi:hypothetical protein